MPVVVRIARELYNLRLEELKKAISEDEEKFLFLVSEIDEIRAGKWDNQLLGLPEPTSEANSTQASPTTEETPVLEKEAEEKVLETSELDQQPLVQQEEEMKVEADNLENEERIIRDEDAPPLVKETPDIDHSEEIAPIVSEEASIPDINISETPVQEEEHTYPLKRSADDTEVLEEPLLKRLKTEELPSLTPPISENPFSGTVYIPLEMSNEVLTFFSLI